MPQSVINHSTVQYISTSSVTLFICFVYFSIYSFIHPYKVPLGKAAFPSRRLVFTILSAAIHTSAGNKDTEADHNNVHLDGYVALRDNTGDYVNTLPTRTTGSAAAACFGLVTRRKTCHVRCTRITHFSMFTAG